MKNGKGNRELTADGERLTVDGLTRREAITLGATAAAAAMLPITPAEAENAAVYVEAALQGAAQGAVYKPKWFQPDEWAEIKVMVDLIIPRDAKSGSATDAGVPQYMDFFCSAYPSYAWVREALRWFDGAAYNSYGKSFVKCTDAERRALLDQVAWPAKAAPGVRDGVNHFNRLRDFTASGFFSSRMGVRDIGYIGNVARPTWNGCPPAALRHLGVD
ncbi:MAG: gluconate 2-dehydrogenase subunit 3 family protein [Gemmatimonadota bacterium]|nr:gluconate 2-dehydrogenase subunit 3 family protein [Gemmatimonadota bacterium]